MQIEQRVKGDVAIVAITGDITLSKGGDVHPEGQDPEPAPAGPSKAAAGPGQRLLRGQRRAGQLVQVYATTSHLGGSLKLLNLTKRLKDLLVLTKLLTVFDAYDTEAEAHRQLQEVGPPSGRPRPVLKAGPTS